MRNPAEAGPADGESCQVKTSQRQINEPLPGLEAPQQLQRLAAPAYINSALAAPAYINSAEERR